MKFLKLFLLMLGLGSSMIAHAHGVQGGGLINGLMHPVFGADHLLAMVAVGVLSVQMGGRAFFAVEIGIALSVLVLGVAIAFDKKMPVIWSMLCVGFFAFFHGYAHGAEMPNLAQPALYALGFIVATAFLHIVGIAIGEISKHVKNGESLLRYAGASIAGIGFAILFGI